MVLGVLALLVLFQFWAFNLGIGGTFISGNSNAHLLRNTSTAAWNTSTAASNTSTAASNINTVASIRQGPSSTVLQCFTPTVRVSSLRIRASLGNVSRGEFYKVRISAFLASDWINSSQRDHDHELMMLTLDSQEKVVTTDSVTSRMFKPEITWCITWSAVGKEIPTTAFLRCELNSLLYVQYPCFREEPERRTLNSFGGLFG